MQSVELSREICEAVRGHILTTHYLQLLQEEMSAFMENVSPSTRAIVRSRIFSRVYNASILKHFVQTSLFREWLETNRTNVQLLAAG